MSKEKLTPKIISKEIIENFDTLKLSWHGMTGIQFHIVTLLEQIKNEVIYEFGSDNVSTVEMNKVFNKYLNEK
jgi:hypothetical protein